MSPAGLFAFSDFLQVLDALPVGTLMVSREGNVLHMNAVLAGLTAFDRDSVPGLPCRHILRAKPCVSGCALGCGAFDAGERHREPASAASGRDGGPQEPVAGVFAERLLRGPAAAELLNAANLDAKGMETDVLTRKKRKVPVRLTHFPVLDSRGRELFRLDIVEDLSELKLLEHRLRQASGHGRMVGRSAAMERISALTPSIAQSEAPVFITGETGTGKDIFAETLHQASRRSREPFVRLNVSPLPPELLAVEIFGQAPPDMPERPGRFQQAGGGVLYISELADIPAAIQARLVEYLDTGAILPVGALREIRPDARLITATNRDPEELLRRGVVSHELFHRLNVVRVDLPPLRDRREDIDFLLRHFLGIFAARFKKEFSGFSPEARALLAAHDYPGNVRELKNIVEYAAMICPTREIGLESLPAHLARFAAEPQPKARKRARAHTRESAPGPAGKTPLPRSAKTVKTSKGL